MVDVPEPEINRVLRDLRSMQCLYVSADHPASRAVLSGAGRVLERMDTRVRDMESLLRQIVEGYADGDLDIQGVAREAGRILDADGPHRG